MTAFNITDTTSVLVTTANTNAFNGDSAGADSLTVGAAAYLIATGSGVSRGALLAPTGAWKVTVNGTIVSKNWEALILDGGNTANSTITVGADGELGGGINSYGLVMYSAATVKNAGTINGANGISIVTPAGTITSITNTGVITGAGGGYTSINGGAADGIVSLTNSGLIQGPVSLGSGSNTIKNTGQIRGDVFLGIGNDVVTNSGTVVGQFSLGGGNDTFKGGNLAETVDAGTGSDNVNLGGGNDTFLAYTGSLVDGLDTVDGGAGIDVYNFGFGSSLAINLDKVAHDSPLSPGTQSVAANTALGTYAAITNTDIVRNFENVTGTPGTDIIYGSAAANRLDGSHGDDLLAGFGGNDTLVGGASLDVLHGGAGRDALWGGTIGGSGDGSFDRFVFTALADSGKTKATRDIIMDFEDGVDQIDLFRIDAMTTFAGDQPFSYINGNSATTPAAMFTKVAGQLRSYLSADGTIIEGDVNGDGKADFSLELRDPNHAIVLTSSDFNI
jgi:hypothetical protein